MSGRSLSIDLVVVIHEHNEEQILRITDIVMPHLWRCRSLTTWHNGDAVHSIFFPLPDRLERLEKLESHARRGVFGAFTLFTEHSAPPLRSLCFKSTCGLPSVDFVPTNTLTHLDLDIIPQTIDQTKFMQFLGRCTVLERLRLSEWIIRELVPENVIPVSLPSLKSLHVNDTLALDFPMYLHTPNIVELCLSSYWDQQPEFPGVRPTILQLETVTWDHQLLWNICHHHLMPFLSVRNLILRNCVRTLDFLCYLATGFPDEPGQTPTDHPEAIQYREPQGHHVLPQLAYLQITEDPDCEETEPVTAAEQLKVLLGDRPSLRVTVSPCVVDDAAAFAAQFGARFTVAKREEPRFGGMRPFSCHDVPPLNVYFPLLFRSNALEFPPLTP